MGGARLGVVLLATAVGLTLALAVHAAVTAHGPLWIQTSPLRFGFEPVDLELRIHLLPDDSDRLLWADAYDVLVDPPMAVQHSSWVVEGGAQAQRLYVLARPWRLTGGSYAIVVSVGPREGRGRITVRTQVDVKPRFGP